MQTQINNIYYREPFIPFYSFEQGKYYLNETDMGTHSIFFSATVTDDSPYYFKDKSTTEIGELAAQLWSDYYIDYLNSRYNIEYSDWTFIMKRDTYGSGAVAAMFACAQVIEGLIHDLFESYTPGTAGREYKVINWQLETQLRDSFTINQSTVERAKEDNGVTTFFNEIGKSEIEVNYPDDTISFYWRSYNCSGIDWHWEYNPLPVLVGEPWEEDLADGVLYDSTYNRDTHKWE